MVDHLAGVVLNAVDEGRLAPAKNGQAQGVESRTREYAAVVLELTFRVDHGYVEPRVVGPVAGRPHDRADLTAAEVELQAGGPGPPRRRRPLRRIDLVGETGRGGPVVEGAEQALQLEVGE